MDIFALIVAFVLGALIGSFLNVVILRFNTGETLSGRSRCGSCGATLSWFDLVPVCSFFILSGRCRYCKSALSLQYPAVELATGALFALAVFLSNSVFEAVLLSALFSLYVVIFVYDLRHTIVPDAFSYSAAGVALVFALLTREVTLFSTIAGPLVATPFAFFWLISRGRWMGLGDAKLALSVGWLLGVSSGFAAVIIAVWIGALVGVGILFRTSQLNRTLPPRTIHHEVPFAPFLIVATVLVLYLSIDITSIFFL